MAKSFKLQLNPTFKASVNIPRIGGDPMVVTFTFKVFDRKELARIFDRWKKENKELIEKANSAEENGEEFTMEDWATNEIEMQVRQVKDVVVGWGFADEFSDENIEALVTTSVSVTDAILEQYNEAYNRARKGN